VLRRREPDGWSDLHTFTPDPCYVVDYTVLSHYVSTHSHSPFVGRLVAQQMTPDLMRMLDGTTLTETRPDGAVQRWELAPADVPAALGEGFGIVLDPADAARLVAWLRQIQKNVGADVEGAPPAPTSPT
jgi:N-hydroxyarylamine O-acetyltransferase